MLKSRKKRTRRTKTKRGGALVSDNKLVSLATSTDRAISCQICKNAKFQMRKGTIGKSKTANVLGNIIFGSESNSVLDISVICYFCSSCGNAITVRDPKAKSDDYKSLIVAKDIN